MLKPENHFVHVRELRLRYVDWGDNGPTILLLHGDLRTSRSWDAVSRDLADRFHVIALDARGHGDSDWPARGYQSGERVAELVEFCELLGLSGIIGAGHSSGGFVTALCASRNPGLFSRLALLEPLQNADEAFQRRVSARQRRPRRTWNSKEELHEYLKQHRTAGRWREDVIRDVVEHEAHEVQCGHIDTKWSSDYFNWEDREGDHHDLRPTLRDLALPTLIICSSERRKLFADLEPIAADRPDFDIVTIANTGHNMYMERPDAVSGAIVSFVSGDTLPEVI